jgi:hypothetical protein
MIRTFLLIFLVASVSNVSFSKENLRKFEFKVIESRDYSIPKYKSSKGRKRKMLLITSESADSFKDRGELIRHVVEDLVKKSKCQSCTVSLVLSSEKWGKGKILASGEFSPDGRGNSGNEYNHFGVVESSGVRKPTRKEIKIMKEFNHVTKYERLGDEDDNDIMKRLAKKNKMNLKKYIEPIFKYMFIGMKRYHKFK